MGIKQLKRKEISCYKSSDLWTQEDEKNSELIDLLPQWAYVRF
jgi:hypothetical protein